MSDLRLRWDEATFLEGAKLAYDYDMRHGWRRYAGWFFIALVQFGVVGALRYGQNGLLLLSTLLVLYWYFLRWPIRQKALRRFFNSSGYAGKELRIEPEEGGICIDGQCLPWREFRRVIASEKGYLLDMEDAFLYLPRRIFPDAETRNTFVALLREHIEKFQRME
ncbi:YcxB family protein [Hydrogenimonas sp.]